MCKHKVKQLTFVWIETAKSGAPACLWHQSYLEHCTATAWKMEEQKKELELLLCPRYQ